MLESLRVLLYPLGYIAAVAFGARFILQWINSEKRKKSVVTAAFWKLSLVGNVVLFVHSLIQIQFHVSMIQAINGVISWRNLNLLKSKEHRFQTKTVILFLLLALSFTTGYFYLESKLAHTTDYTWFRNPNTKQASIPIGWHLFGFIGLALFNSRFWIQWWGAEVTKTSSISRSFWWVSLVGSIICLIYFFYIGDKVNMIGPFVGIVPYIRNLMLLSKAKTLNTVTETS